MDTDDKFKLLNKMGKCEAQPGMSPDTEQKYCVVFKIWIGTKWATYQWAYGRTVDAAIDEMWTKLQNELWLFITQRSRHDNN